MLKKIEAEINKTETLKNKAVGQIERKIEVINKKIASIQDTTKEKIATIQKDADEKIASLKEQAVSLEKEKKTACEPYDNKIKSLKALKKKQEGIFDDFDAMVN